MRLFVHVGNRYQMAVDLLLGDNSCRFKVRFHLDNAIKLTSGADFSELKGENFSIFSASDSLLFDPKNRKLLSEGVQKLSKDLTFSKAKQSKNDIEGTFVTTKDGELEATNSMEFLMEPNSVSSVIFSPEKQRKLSTRFLDGALEIGVSDNKGTIEDTFVLNLRKLKLSKV